MWWAKSQTDRDRGPRTAATAAKSASKSARRADDDRESDDSSDRSWLARRARRHFGHSLKLQAKVPKISLLAFADEAGEGGRRETSFVALCVVRCALHFALISTQHCKNKLFIWNPYSDYLFVAGVLSRHCCIYLISCCGSPRLQDGEVVPFRADGVHLHHHE
jgi:hypothetical protein